MSSLLSRGQAMLNRVAAEQSPCGDTVYTPAANPSQAWLLPCWLGRTQFAGEFVSGNNAARVQWGDRDYLCTVAAFEEIFGDGARPKDGDTITENGVGTFRLTTPTGEPSWRYSDQTRTAFRMHVKRVS